MVKLMVCLKKLAHFMLLVIVITLLCSCNNAENSNNYFVDNSLLETTEELRTITHQYNDFTIIEKSNNIQWEYHVFSDGNLIDSIYLLDQEGMVPHIDFKMYNNCTWILVDKVLLNTSEHRIIEQIWYIVDDNYMREYFKFTKEYVNSCTDLGFMIHYSQDVEPLELENFILTFCSKESILDMEGNEIIFTEEIQEYDLLSIDVGYEDHEYDCKLNYKGYIDLEHFIEENYFALMEIHYGVRVDLKEWLDQLIKDNLDQEMFMLNHEVTFNVLKDWCGSYEFYEFAEPNINMLYNLEIYEDNQRCYADITIDGFQTLTRINAKIFGDSESIGIYFYKYNDENVGGVFEQGDLLFLLEKDNANIFTIWDMLQPILNENKHSGSTCFEKI